jgi:intracellular multiplication protein IcmD
MNTNVTSKFYHWGKAIAVSLLLWVKAVVVFGASLEGPSLGGMAQSMLVPIDVMTLLMYKICYILGGAMIVGSGVQYKAHRDNPQQIPINRPIFLLIIGLVLVALPLIAQLSGASSASTGS